MPGPLRLHYAHAIRTERWREALEQALRCHGRSREDLQVARKGVDWKIALADELRKTCGANQTWLARELNMGKPSSVRRLRHRWRNRQPV